MIKPFWRRMILRTKHAVSFTMRAFFAFQKRVQKSRVFNVFFNNTNKKKIFFISASLVLVFSSAVIFFAATAKAEKEVHAYISASLVSGEGFENINQAQLQDLSVDARLSDFTSDVSSRVAFGAYAGTVYDKPIDIVSTTTSSSTPSDVENNSSEIKLENSSTTEIINQSTSSKESKIISRIKNNSKLLVNKFFNLKTVLAQEQPEVQSQQTEVTPNIYNVLSNETSKPSETTIISGENTNTSISSPIEVNSSTTQSSTNNTTVPDTDKKEDRDPYKVASCSTFGMPCHLVVLEGFGVDEQISKYPVKDARLMLSLAGKAAPSEMPDRIIVRAYKNDSWDYLGEQVVRGEFDNAMRGGYLTFPLALDSWSDLAGMIVSVEYVREGESDSVVLLDSAWVDISFESDESPDDLALYSPNVKSALLARDAERRAKERDHLELQNGLSVDFKNTLPGLVNSKLRVATSKEKHSILGSGEEYVSVTNFSNSSERVHLSFYFPEEGGRIDEISKYTHNSELKVVESKSSPIAYYCEGGWNASTSTDEIISDKTYFCSDGSEPHACSSISTDGTSCLSEITSIGKEESVAYRRFFEPDSIFSGSYSEKQSIIGKVLDNIFGDMPDGTIPASVKEVSYSNTFDIEPGTTKYFRVGFDTPLNSRGDIYIKAEGESGVYGLAKTEFDGSWNWRIPVDIGLPYRVNNQESAVPISLNNMPLSFWDHVTETGSDIRFSDEDGINELPFWVSEFNKNTKKGLVWVRLPESSGVMPRIYLYAGNENSDSVYKPWLPFTTNTLTGRAVVVSNGVENSTLQVTALAPFVRVSVGDGEEKTLLYGETVLFNDVKNSSVIKATGPVSVRASSIFGRATVAPLGLASTKVSIPSETLELGVVTAQGEEGEFSLDDNLNTLSPKTVFRTPISEERKATSSVPTIFVADRQDDSLILSDENKEDRFNLSSSVVLDKKANGVRAMCRDDRYFGAYDSRGSLLATSTCGKILNGPFDEGTIVSVFNNSTSSPFSAVFSALYNGDERIIYNSDSNSRNPAGYDPEVAFGEPEYVIPGEHRVFDSEFNKDKPHITRFLSKKREFSAGENPSFKFQYKPQSSSFFRTLRSLIGLPPFKVENVVVEQSGQPVDIKTEIEYTGNLEWVVKIDKKDSEKIAPGKLTLRMTIKEGLSTYEDAYDFYWGLLSINFNKSVYEKGETSEISLGALSESGNTICNAKLKLFVTDAASSTNEINVKTSGVCDGNNIVDVPDYTAEYTPVDVGTYNLRLVRLDDDENIVAEVRDSFEVVSHQSFIIERKGPTRINPTSPYEMTIRAVAREGYVGTLREKIPVDFEVINRGGSTLEWADKEHTAKVAVWNVDMKPGEVYQFTYKFDAPDKSPFIYFLGPATIGDGDNTFTEKRRWMIASDVAGKMIIYWANGLTPPPPANWACISCGGGADNSLVNRWPMGSSTYGVFGGASTHQPSVTASVSDSIYTSAGLVNGAGTALVYKDHTHTFTPTISVASHLPPSLSLKAYKNLNAGEQTIPSGAILFFETMPSSGWTEVSAMNGYFPYGANSVATATGTATHTHTISGTTGAPVTGGVYASNNRATAVANSTHTHVVTSTTTNAVTNAPPYVTLIMASADSAGNIPNGAISMWDADPAPGWLNLSASGGILENRFVKVATSSGSTGGSSLHTHTDILGVTTAGAVGSNQVPNNSTSAFGSPVSHTHTVDYTSFTDSTNLPPYSTVIFAKRSVGVTEFTQEKYRFYDNVNDQQPVDPWPANEIDLSENSPIEDSSYRIKPGNTFRVRMSAGIANATSTSGTNPIKLQYSTDGVCSSALNWNDIGAPGSSSPLRGYDNNLVNHGVILNNTLLSSSTVSALQFYSESNSAVNFVQNAGIGTIAEFDWVLNANSNLASSSRYCLRMVENSGRVFGQYKNYPSFLTNKSPEQPTLVTQFNHAKLMTLTPTLTFSTSDEEGNSVHYAIEIDDDPNFGSPNVSHTTSNNSSYFTNLTNPSNKAPYTNGDLIQYQVQSGALTNNTTYWWRVRAVDPVGSTQFGVWSEARAFTIDTSLTTSAWFQTTDAQFSQNIRDGINVTSNSARLASGSTTATMYSPEIIFNDGPFGTVWGSFSFVDDGGSGITYQIEYKSVDGSWLLVPDSVLSGNSAGFGTSPISLTSIDPLYYPSLRIKANYTNSGTPILYDWTVVWAYKTLAPILYSQFNHAKVSTTTPTISFASTDPLGRSITYEVQYSTDPLFTSSTTCNSGGACSAGFKNLTTATNTSPFISGNTIQFKFQTALTNGTTYFWRTRGYGTGGGAWSFWSETRAFTVDTSATTYPTWFQTMKGQWSMDTLSGVYANSSNSVAVATTSDKVLITYGKGADNKPKYRLYESGTLSSEKDMLSIGSAVLWSVAKTSLANDQFIVGTMGSNRAIKYQVFENGIWSRMITFPEAGPSAQRRSFGLSFESKSGKAMAISCNGTNADYAIFDGSSWGSVSTVNLGFTNNCELVKTASNPIKNEIIAVFRDTGLNYHVEVWDGTSWSSTNRFNFSTAAGIIEPAHDGMAVEYEGSSGRAMVVVSRRSTRGFVYRLWNGTSWGTETTSNNLGNNTSAQFEWGNIRRDPASNDLMLCAVSQYADNDDGAFTDYVRWNSGTSAWVATKLGQYYPYTRHGQNMDCEFETKSGRTGRIVTVSDESWQIADGSTTLNRSTWDSLLISSNTWQSGSPDTGRRWNYSGTTYNWNGSETWTDRIERASYSGDIINIGLARNTLDYIYRVWNGSTWGTAQSLGASSVTTKPLGQPFDMIAQDGFNQGVIFSQEINFADGNAPSWRQARFTTTKPVSTNVLVSVEYWNGTDWLKIPDSQIPGNSSGTSTSPINLQNVNSQTYNKIRLRADLACNGLSSCPTLDDWTVEWTEGLAVSGIARDSNRTTPLTSGTVKIAVNGVEQTGKTATISGTGTWSISGVNYKVGETVTAWIDNPGVSNRAVSVVKYSGGGSLSNVELSRKWLVIGDSSQSGVVIENSDIKIFDNNNEAGTTRADIFFNVDSTNNLLVCNTGNCSDFSVAVSSGTTWRPSSSSGTTNTMYSLSIGGVVTADANTIKVGGNWINAGSFSSGNSTVVFNATSSTKIIDNTGASLFKFNNVTFGEVATAAVWQLSSPLYTNGDLNINYGTLSPLSQPISIEKNLSIGASGFFTKGSATTTFLGADIASWSDSTAAGQDMGNVLVDGSPKQLSLSSSVKATNLTIAPADTFSFGVNNITLLGSYTNNGIVLPGSGKLTISSAGNSLIKQGGYSLNNITITSGNVSWSETQATSTGDVYIQGGTTTLPSLYYVGGSFIQTAGTYTPSSELIMFSSSPGKQISSISNLSNITFNGNGSWLFVSSATTTGNVKTISGTVTFPSSTLSIKGSLINSGANLDGNGGNILFNGSTSMITLGGSVSLNNLSAATGSIVGFTELNATTSGSIISLAGGTFNLPNNGSITVGGSVINNGIMNANASTIYMNRASGAASLSAGAMTVSSLVIGGGGDFTIYGNTNISANFTLNSVGSFTLETGRQLEIFGFFTNNAANATTNWSGTTLKLSSGATMSINSKTSGSDDYNIVTLTNNTQLRLWNSTITTINNNASSSVYGQNWAGISGDLRIYGYYIQNGGTIYWDYSKDFDGTPLGVNSRAVNVRSAYASTVDIKNATLEAVGISSATSTITSITGMYYLKISSSTINAKNALFRSMMSDGMNISGSSTFASFDYVDVYNDMPSGYAMTLSKDVIDLNNGKEFLYDSFKYGPGASSTASFNVKVNGTTTSYIRFKAHGGTLSGESKDNDPSGDPGEVRWDDSSYLVSISGNVYSDAGVTAMDSSICDGSTQSISIKVSGGGFYKTSCAANGAFSANNISLVGSSTVSIYLDDVSAKGVVVTKRVTSNLSDIKLYQDRIILRHEDPVSMSISSMSGYDADDDPDMLFTANSGSLSVPSSYELWIWNSMKFRPGGNVTTGSGGSTVYGGALHVDNNATYDSSNNYQINIGGRLQIDSGSTFNTASSTVTFSPTDTRSVISVNPINFYNIRFQGTGTTTLSQSINVSGNIYMNSGSLTGTGNITLNNSITGNGTVLMTGGTLSLLNGGSFGGSKAWQFYNLSLGDGLNTSSTTKNGTAAATTTIKGLLTVKANHLFDLSDSKYLFTGSGDVINIQGTLDTTNTDIVYSPTSNVNVANIQYNNLQFAGNGTSTLPNMNLSVLGNFVVGNGANTTKVDATTNDPSITIGGNLTINSNARFIASDTGPISLNGSWMNSGTFVNSSGNINFVGAGNKTINPGNSSFGSVKFIDVNGSWTITENATATSMYIGSSTSWTLASGKTLEITGNFQNLLGNGNTTWTGSTLYINTGTRDEINTRDVLGDVYENLKVGSGTSVVMWNSSSTQFITASGGGVLSQNHAGVSGDLNIYGNYTKTTGSEYWSYLLDFDGTVLNAGQTRQVRVKFASGASATYSGTSLLEIVGKPTASTTIRSTSGTYSLNIGGSTSTMQYVDFSNMDTNGIQLSNSVKVTQMDDVSFSNPSGTGTMMTIAASVITANPLRTTYNDSFNSTGGNNIKVVGTTASAWRIRNHYGNRSGEAYDVDPAGDPGYVIWDDSAAQIYITGKVLQSDGVSVSSICNGITQNVFLKVQGSGTLTSACSATDGSYTIGPVVYAPFDTLAVYTTTGSVAYAYRPMTNIADMDLYEKTVIVRNEQSDSITNAGINSYDKDNNSTLLARVTGSNLVIDNDAKLIVWNAKSYAPGGNVTMSGNTNISSIDGDIEIRSNGEWITSGAEQYTIGGDFLMGSNSKVTGGAGQFIFNSNVSGKVISASTPITLTNLTFNSTGSWTISGVSTTTGNVLIQNGNVTLPNTSFAVGGDFNNQSTFNSNGGTLIFTATTSGKQIRSNGNNFGSISFLGTGSWSFLDNATTTGNFTIASGTPTLPSGNLSINGDFENIGGSFISNNGTVVVKGSGSRKVSPGGSSFGNLRIENGSYSTNMLDATTTGDLIIASGSLILPENQLAVGGTFRNSGTFTAGATSTVRMTSTTTGKIINPGSSSFNNLVIDGSGGGFTIEANTIVNNVFTIKTANSFVQSSSTMVTVKDLFTNNVGGTWTGSTLRLEKAGTSTINSKTDNAANYNNIELGPNVNISSWKSSYANVTLGSNSSIYSQNDGNVSGTLKIYGTYAKTSGTDYWSSTRDFDGAVIAARSVNVRIANNSSVSYSGGATLETVGDATRITNIQSIAGNYSFEVNSGTFKGNYFKFRNVDSNGIKLTGTTTIVMFDNADLATGVDAGKILHIDGTVVDQNTGSVFSNDIFALGSGHTSGTNVYLNGTTNNSLTFTGHSGGLDGESYDSDGATSCGAFRWDDSSCQFIDQRYYRWRNDDGGEAVPDSEWLGGSSSGWPYRERVHIVNNSTVTASNVAVKLTLPYQSQMRSDFGDIRFTSNDGVTSIPYWLEKYSSASNATIWVKVPQILAKSSADVFVYYGNSSATSTSSGSNTFTYIYNADSGLTGMSGDTSSFITSSGPTPIPPLDSQTSPAYLRAVDTSGMTDGMAYTSANVARGSTIREKIYINGTENDDTCLTFGVGSPITNNWGFCVSPLQASKNVRLVKDAKRDGFSPNISQELVTSDVTLTTAGWYSARIDWETTGNITAKLYDPSGNEVASLNGTDNYNPGSGIGFSYWYQHGAWDNILATPYLPGDPTVIVLTPQQHGGATWKASENTSYMTAYQNDVLRLRFGIRNTGTALNDQAFRLDYALKGTYPNCESVPDGNYMYVRPESSCGSYDICMATSTRFADNDATTPLLSTPKGLSFIQGRMVESPSNSTPGYNLPANTFTEVEYAIRFTNSAMQPSYCLRVTNNGSRLVSYTKVAEAGVLQPPSISNWNFTSSPIYLNEGTTTRVMATGTVTDFNGASDIISATSTLYRSGVSGGANCSSDDNNCYSGAKTSCSLSGCSGLSCTVSCYADVQYFAEKTDYGTYSGDDWRFAVTVKDSQNLSDSDTAVSELIELKALSLSQPTINYGDIDVGSSTAPGANPKVTLSNTGNSSYSLELLGSDLTAAGSLIPVSNQLFATSTFQMGSCSLCAQLSSSTPVMFGLTLPKPVSTTPVTGDIYFGIQIPYGTKALTHNGSVSISAN